MSDIQETINRLRELDRKASPAPWSIVKYGGYEYYGETPHEIDSIKSAEEDVAKQLGCHACDDGLYSDRIENFEYIVQARNAIPALLAEIERLAEENRALKRENHLAWSKGHAAGWDCHIVTMQSADLLPKDQKTSSPYQEKK